MQFAAVSSVQRQDGVERLMVGEIPASQTRDGVGYPHAVAEKVDAGIAGLRRD